MVEEKQAFPLAWPNGWKRTDSWHRGTPRFKSTFALARDGLLEEIRRFGGSAIVLSSNVPLRNDGLPYASARSPEDPGVAVYFKRKGKPAALACDKWKSVAENIRALQLTVDAMRGIDRWGSSELMERSFTGFTALPAPAEWHWKTVLGFPVLTTPTLEMVRDQRNLLLKKYHPDIGDEPNHQKTVELNRAFEQAKGELG